MAVYVDDLKAYGMAPKPGAERYFGNGKRSCHMTADTDAELFALAARIGLRRAWVQPGRGHIPPHFDLTPTKRGAALKAGAIYKSIQEQVAEWRAACALTPEGDVDGNG